MYDNSFSKNTKIGKISKSENKELLTYKTYNFKDTCVSVNIIKPYNKGDQYPKNRNIGKKKNIQKLEVLNEINNNINK